MVLGGWFLHSPRLVQVHPSLVPMQFNTALGLLGSAAALLLHLLGRRRSALVAAAVPLALGASALIETYGHVSLGIDQLFVQPFTTVHTEFPGRMSVNSAVAFCGAGATLLLLIGAPRRQATYLAVALLSGALTALGLNALFGYAAQLQITYAWTTHSQMAVHTATGFTLVGVAAFARAWLESLDEFGDSPAWIGIPVLVGASMVSIAAWQTLLGLDHAQIRRVVQTEAVAIGHSVTDEVHNRLTGLRRVARRWELNPGMSRREWERDAGNYLAFQPDVTALEFIDRDGDVRWVAPIAGNEALINRTAAHDATRAAFMNLARQTHVPTITPGVPIEQGGRGFLIYVPRQVKGRYAGLIAGIFRYPAILANVTAEAYSQGFDFAVIEEGVDLFRTSGDVPTATRSWGQEVRVDLPMRDWYVHVWPTPQELTSLHSNAPITALLLGLLISLLLAGMAQSGRMVRIQGRSVREANIRLASQVREREAAEERFRSALEAVPNAIVIADTRGRISLVNSQTLHWLGYRREDLIGAPIEVLLPERHRFLHQAHRDTYVQQPVTRPMGEGLSLVARRKDGSEFPVDISLGPLHTRDGLEVIAAITDVTLHRQAQAELKQSNSALNAVNQELESFSYAVSHDLRQPLRAMVGFGQILIEDYRDRLDTQGQDYLQRIQFAANRMGNLIDALLRLSRITRSQIAHAPVNLSQLTYEIAAQLASGEPERQVEWHVEDAMSVKADDGMLRALLENLLGNAWKFTAGTPHARIDVGQERNNGHAQFYVRDNGAGFDMAYADKLFGAFQRLHRTDEFPGTGIGLATSQRIVHRHGGRIWAEGQVGAGATFHFTLQA
ncbi:MAG TPA: ATP-binding protein [bacterium]|nr:ATP-binding protein [bacterium]